MDIKIIALSLFATTISLTGFAQETVISGKQIPQEITAYVTRHFPGQKLLQVVKDRDDFTVKYEVILDNRTKLEFNSKKQITEIDGKSKLPDSVIPSKILSYVKANYPDNYITDWDLDKRKQSVELDNNLSLEFSRAGTFLRIDD